MVIGWDKEIFRKVQRKSHTPKAKRKAIERRKYGTASGSKNLKMNSKICIAIKGILFDKIF